MKLTEQEFTAWAGTKWVEYASTDASIRRGKGSRLRFYVGLGRDAQVYKVTLDNDLQYLGTELTAAIGVFNYYSQS